MLLCGLELLRRQLFVAALVVRHFDRAFKRVELDHAPARAGVGVAGFAALFGQVGEQVVVHIVFVLQTAHQASAGAADLFRVERQLLISGHPDRDGAKTLKPGRTARTAAAHPERTDDAGLVARADVVELESRARQGRQLVSERPQ